MLGFECVNNLKAVVETKSPIENIAIHKTSGRHTVPQDLVNISQFIENALPFMGTVGSIGTRTLCLTTIRSLGLEYTAAATTDRGKSYYTEVIWKEYTTSTVHERQGEYHPRHGIWDSYPVIVWGRLLTSG